MLFNQANTEMATFKFKETVMSQVYLWDNGYAEISINTGPSQKAKRIKKTTICY